MFRGPVRSSPRASSDLDRILIGHQDNFEAEAPRPADMHLQLIAYIVTESSGRGWAAFRGVGSLLKELLGTQGIVT